MIDIEGNQQSFPNFNLFYKIMINYLWVLVGYELYTYNTLVLKNIIKSLFQIEIFAVKCENRIINLM